ncbi:MAG: helix-turn-helix transcriptional regulator [Anaerolineae bacterium]|jgi:transcriptional regulator with XRE-family HTH domain
MDAPQTIAIRDKIIGVLVRQARLGAGKSQRECAELMGCSPSTFSKYERGKKGLSLPQLEILAYFFEVPIQALLDAEYLDREEEEKNPLPLEQIMQVRQKILGVQFRQCREASGLTQREMADMMGCSTYMVARYESGKADIPLAQLEIAVEQCGRSLGEFLDDQTVPLGKAEEERQMLARLEELPDDVRDFILKPSNSLYLRIALLLSAMKADSLRQIAETLLDITY